MASYFECLRCGVVTVVEVAPPKCSQCGHGTGILHASRPDKLDRQGRERPGDTPGHDDEPKEPSAARTPEYTTVPH
jgi:hypothetical protein